MDKYIISGNSTGKTRRMLEEAAKDNAVVVCKSSYAMQNKANAYGLVGLRCIEYGDVNEEIVAGEKIAIDELGDFFKARFNTELDAFTMTVD